MPHKHMRTRDFEAFQEIVSAELDIDHGECDAAIVECLTSVVRAFADHNESSNTRFDRARFYAGCGIGSNGYGRAGNRG